MTVLTKKSILARLLARENITVEQTNHHTAFFDVENRVLGIPYWKDVSKDLYDLFVGHEIGHALHTPAEGWHSSTTEIPGCPRSYINVVEDIRIEKLVLREYPGLLGSFMRGYKDLLDRDFFGIEGVEINTLSFMNRLNLFSKSRGLVDVRFSSKEQPFVDRAMATETWQDVMDSCREIYAFMQEELEAQKNPEPEDVITVLVNGNGNSSGDSKISDKPADVDLRTKGNSTSKAANQEDEGEKKIPAPAAAPAPADEELDSTGGSDNIDVVETDTLFRGAIAKSLVDSFASGGSTLFIKGPTKAQAIAVTAPYEEVRDRRTTKITSPHYPTKQYSSFMAKTKNVVSVMVKEFEMRKTARRFARARQSVRGSLDVTQLYKYKYDDTIFKQVTEFDDDQSHGLVMLVDYSGSMNPILSKVLKQILILTMFCKRTNVPFEVYGFTNPNWRRGVIPKQTLTSLNMSNTHIFKLIDSSMSKTVYDEAFKMLFAQTTNKRKLFSGGHEVMAGTPLSSSVAVMYHHIAAFKAKHNVQKMNFITLTDGDSDYLGTDNGIDVPRGASTHHVKKRVIEIMGQKIKLDAGSGTEDLLNGLRKMGIRTMNYHFIRQQSLKWYIQGHLLTPEDLAKSEAKTAKEGCFVVDNQNGYDRQIFTVLSVNNKVKAKSNVHTNQDQDEDEEDLDEEVQGFAESFTQKAFSKKRDRLIAIKFAETLS
jgi:hypothetical protein